MKKHQADRKLKLDVETLQRLSNDSLDRVAGGIGETQPQTQRSQFPFTMCLCELTR